MHEVKMSVGFLVELIVHLFNNINLTVMFHALCNEHIKIKTLLLIDPTNTEMVAKVLVWSMWSIRN